MVYQTPTDLTITIPGPERYWIAEAILEMAMSIERDAETKRKSSPGRRRAMEHAQGLRDLSNRIR